MQEPLKPDQPIEILLVEDNPGDSDLTLLAMKRSKVTHNVSVVRDGIEAMDFLCRRGKYPHAPHPDLILLDLNLPLKDGRQVLAEIKADEALKRIPVIVLTTSNAESDIVKSYNLHANCFIAKPFNFDQFMRVIKSLDEFWLSIVELPPRE